MARNEEPPGPVEPHPDADPRTPRHRAGTPLPSDPQWSARQVEAVVLAQESQAGADAARAREQDPVGEMWPTAPQDIEAHRGFERADEDRGRKAGLLGDHVQAVVHAVGEVDV